MSWPVPRWGGLRDVCAAQPALTPETPERSHAPGLGRQHASSGSLDKRGRASVPKPPRVEYVITKPNPPTWWRKNRHLVLLVVGLFVGAWLVSSHDSTAASSPDRPRPAHSGVPEPGNSDR